MIAIAFSSSDSRLGLCRGFTLIEMAVAIFIIALLLGSILVPLQSQVESRNYSDTQRILDQAREALLGYAAAYGYLPCPADYAEVSAGAEATHTVSTGDCLSSGAGRVDGGGAIAVYIGFLPAVTLGFTATDGRGYAVDAWGLTQNRIRYAVSYSTVNGVTKPFTRTNGVRMASMSNVMNANLLNVCSTATGASTTACASASTTLTSSAVAVIWSLGANAATSGGVSADEAKNAQPRISADRVFIDRDRSSVSGAEFDDVVTWISPSLLFNRLIVAGQLP